MNKALFTRSDMDSLVAAVDIWGHVTYSTGFGPVGVMDAADLGEWEIAQRAEASERRDAALLVLAEMVDEGRMTKAVATPARRAMKQWAEHREALGAATRASLKYQTAELATVQLREEDRSQELRLKWAKPLINLLG